MPTNTLTDAKCRAAKPAAKAVKLFDGGGLHLCVTPKGAKAWRVAYRLNGKPQTMSLGPYPEVSLADARLKRDELKATLRESSDPMAPSRARRAGKTLQACCEAYLQRRQDASAGYRRNAERALEMHVYPLIGAKPVAAIERADLLLALNRMDAAGLHVYVRKVRMWLSLVLDQCVEQGDVQVNAAALIDPRKAFGRSAVESFAALRRADMPALLQRLALEGELQSVLARRLLALTWVRASALTRSDPPVRTGS